MLWAIFDFQQRRKPIVVLADQALTNGAKDRIVKRTGRVLSVMALPEVAMEPGVLASILPVE